MKLHEAAKKKKRKGERDCGDDGKNVMLKLSPCGRGFDSRCTFLLMPTNK